MSASFWQRNPDSSCTHANRNEIKKENTLELLNIDCLGKSLRLEGSMAGWQQLFWDNNLVSVIPASVDYQGIKEHQFELQTQPINVAETDNQTLDTPTIQTITVRLVTDLTWQPFAIRYQLLINNQQALQGTRDSKDIEQQTPVTPIKQQKKLSVIGLTSLGFQTAEKAPK